MNDTEKLDLILSNLINLPTKNDVQTIVDSSVKAVVKAAKLELYDEIIKSEIQVDKLSNHVNSLSDKVDTLLLQADNTSLLLKLINKQSEELEILKSKVAQLEQKLA